MSRVGQKALDLVNCGLRLLHDTYEFLLRVSREDIDIFLKSDYLLISMEFKK